MMPLVEEMFAMFDADGDGKLDDEEMQAFLKGPPPRPPATGTGLRRAG
eukprot:COSAG04_NODE_1392_length_6955_cov_22.011960_7_plen_48_part_00